MADPYWVLGVPKTATKDEIKKAYRKLCMQHHPDRLAGKHKLDTAEEIAVYMGRSRVSGTQLVHMCRHAMSPEHVQKNAAAAFKAVSEAYELLVNGTQAAFLQCAVRLCHTI